MKLTLQEHREELTKVNRHQLGIIDLSDATNLDIMSSSERKSYLEQAELIHANPIFKKEIATLLQEQIEFIASSCESWEQSLVGRGQISGISLLSERFEQLHSLYLDSIKKEEQMDGDEQFDVV